MFIYSSTLNAAVMLFSPFRSLLTRFPCLLSRCRNRRNAQRLDLQRGWAEEKGGLRRAAEDALRRVVDSKTRAEEEAALKVCVRRPLHGGQPPPRDTAMRLNGAII